MKGLLFDILLQNQYTKKPKLDKSYLFIHLEFENMRSLEPP